MSTSEILTALFSRIPRRHTTDNVKELYAILDEYEDVLREVEADPVFEKEVAIYFDDLDSVRDTIKNSSLNKHSKQTKDKLFDEGSGMLKDSMESLMKLKDA
ncbi:MAG: hypothetical protein EOO13_05045 [Chitinophagaceae bacterium]|nr:MAG: hypothetical protein EOO13_05045 [Chitinophagaceae bacterium]